MNKLSVLIQSLQNPRLYFHKIDYFKIIETHISWVILTGSYAYKIKKPLNLGFLDFSSLEKRKLYCHEELRLNARLAPDIYLSVVAISGTESEPKLDGSGNVFEYAVKMSQFEPDNTFDQLLIHNQLTNEHIKQTAKIIAAFHTKIKSAEADKEFGNVDAVMRPVQENFSQIQQLSDIEKPDVLIQLKLWSEQQHKNLTPVFKLRKEAGFIRECHGDLHLANIALIDDIVVPFDGIEFNQSLYWIDVISEIAFLVMDLQEKQRPDLAFQFLNGYLQYSGDYSGLKLLRFYLVYRAMVRAKVSAIRANQRCSDEQYQQAITSYQDYLKLASSYTKSYNPIMIIMHGLSGSGKSWLSEQIIGRYPVIRLRSDVERKRLHKLPAQQKSYSALDFGMYNQDSSEKTYQNLLLLAIEIINTNYSVIVDATFLQKKQRKLFSRQAEQLRVPFIIVHTQADKQMLIKRLSSRAKQLDNVSDADLEVLEKQYNNFDPLSDEEQKNSITIDTDQVTQLSMLWKSLDQAIVM